MGEAQTSIYDGMQASIYQAFEDVPAHMVAEIINGELVTHPRPAFPHSRAAFQLGLTLGSPFDRGINGPGGWVILAEPELGIDGQILVPDLAGWRTERAPSISGTVRSDIAPDWICEVLSPSTIRYDIGEKKDIYASLGVPHLWFVDPVMRTLQTLELEGGSWTMAGYYAADQSVHARPFEAIVLELKWLWGEGREESKSGNNPGDTAE